jgi:hypothetical protein
MEIPESIAWVALGFLPVFGSMELVCRLGKKKKRRRSFKSSTKGAIIKKVSVDGLHK